MLKVRAAIDCHSPVGDGGLTAVMPIIVTPDWSVDIGKHFDPAEFVRLCKDAHVECVEFLYKEFPRSSYVAIPRPSRPTDWATETRQRAREARIKFFVFYSTGMDNWMAKQHPDWACVNAAGEPMKKLW